MKKLLIDCSLTGGRGPAKKTAEFIWECKRKKINFFLIADKKLSLILRNLGVIPNKTIDTNYSENPKVIYDKFENVLGKIKFDFLIKFGARPVGPYFAKKLNIPYLIVDGGLPDRFESYPSIYDKKTYVKAKKYILTTNFPWKPPVIPFLKNVEVCYFPISTRTRQYLSFLKKSSRQNLLKRISKFLTAFPKKYDLIINLCLTNDYVQAASRITYGAILTNRQYDQVVGFVRRLIADIGILLKNKKVVLMLDTQIAKVCFDLFKEYSNIYPVTWKKNWNYFTEITFDAISDISISRAANYQPFIFAMARGNNITTAVPADGYMNEDEAASDAADQGLTYNILYDDNQYLKKIINFYQNQKMVKQIARNQEKNFETFGQKNNTLDCIFKTLAI